MNINQDNRFDRVRDELYISLGMASDDSLLNEYEWVDVDSHGNFNNAVHLDDDDEDEEVDGEYHGEANDDGEQVLGNELELCDVDREMDNEFTEEDVVLEHARLKGFPVVKRNSNKKGGGNARYITYYCDRARIRKTKFTTKSNNCKARLAAVLDDSGCWRVSKVVHDHNHDLLPSISRPMAGHRSVCDSLKTDLVAHDRFGIRPSKNIRLAEVQRGGPRNLGCTTKDCRNFILKSSNFEMQEGDAQSLLNFFHEIQVKDREFFYSIDVDNISRLQNMVWVHSHCKAAYEKFYDAICFDTTYLMNRYNTPCATFVGINHHRQSILLGCALMSHEDINSYKLVFRTWLDAMGNVHPDAIITDQCQSIKVAITEVMPNTIHRYCIWHIFSKFSLYLSGVRPSKIARGEFKSMVLDSITVEVFERKWTEYIARYNFHTRNWFNKLYSEKEKWVPVYLDVYFWAGMLSTQRSEGMHAFFDGYITRQSTLRMFVHQSELAIRAKHEKELEAEYRSKGFQIVCESMFKWEEQAIQCYTRTVYEFFKTQLRKLYHCEVSSPDDHQVVPGVEKIIVSDYSVIKKNDGNPVEYTIEYIPIGDYFSCSCKWFKSRGILYCHILKILSHKKIDKIDERYILTR
ncbi:PREDICTED: protein FAR1-RELATED SEQUENCE 5-like [Nicotiana attenuata]|uniref:protein FAR1-RELATED SEQUENCE 5-like n=1 Tax=Nicotiana attenuata TaxID=49451 RepID=UPI00090554FB|nr:PREDICTED: protein FAR1-RELATED SEQUENCE 5-like [Nicotiana attenuata]